MPSIERTYRERRISLGLTQDQAASTARISRKTISDFENGRGAISLAKLTRLLRSVGLDLATRESSSRPTLDELSMHYPAEAAAPLRQRARRKRP